MAKKMTKGERRNQFLMYEATRRADQKVRDYLNKESMALDGVNNHDAAMGAIIKAMMRMYADGVSDALDTEDGRPLTEL